MSGRKGYEVGYGRPPVSTRFQKGHSGNPKGRTKGSKNLATLVSEALEEEVVVTVGGRRRKMSKLQAAFIQQANKAAAGDAKSTKLMLDLLAAEEARAANRPASNDDPQARRAKHQAVLQALKDRLDQGEDGDGR